MRSNFPCRIYGKKYGYSEFVNPGLREWACLQNIGVDAETQTEFNNNMTAGSKLTYLLPKLQQVFTIKIPTLLFQVSG